MNVSPTGMSQHIAPAPLAATLASVAALQERARASAVRLREPPPLPTTCCGRGCQGCVWEGFYVAAQCWLEEAERQLS